jgi:hypothetical protein
MRWGRASWIGGGVGRQLQYQAARFPNRDAGPTEVDPVRPALGQAVALHEVVVEVELGDPPDADEAETHLAREDHLAIDEPDPDEPGAVGIGVAVLDHTVLVHEERRAPRPLARQKQAGGRQLQTQRPSTTTTSSGSNAVSASSAARRTGIVLAASFPSRGHGER